jgi:hypothetical protein
MLTLTTPQCSRTSSSAASPPPSASVSFLSRSRCPKADILRARLRLALQPCSWTYASEIFPTRVRGKAVSFATASNWM